MGNERKCDTCGKYPVYHYGAEYPYSGDGNAVVTGITGWMPMCDECFRECERAFDRRREQLADAAELVLRLTGEHYRRVD